MAYQPPNSRTPPRSPQHQPRSGGNSGHNTPPHHHRSSPGESPRIASHPSHSHQLCVLDMGLDFKSYGHLKDPKQGTALLTNMFTYSVHSLSQTFAPTCGLLITVLHQALACRSNGELASLWLEAYVKLQKAYILRYQSLDHPPANQGVVQSSASLPSASTSAASASASAANANSGSSPSAATRDFHNPAEGRKYAEEAIRAVTSPQPAARTPADLANNVTRLVNTLLSLLDRQSGMRGNNAPSQRKVQSDPRIMHCNLDLAAHSCHQGFLCNQLHQLRADSSHRAAFFRQLVEVLKSQANVSDAELAHRLQDAIFYANYGNRVTVVAATGGNVQFFKTNYTRGRLLHALRMAGAGHCPSPGACANADCPGVHVSGTGAQSPQRGGGRGGHHSGSGGEKAVDLPNPSQVAEDIQKEAAQILRVLEQRTPPPSDLSPPAPVDADASTASPGSAANGPTSGASTESIPTMANASLETLPSSPTTRKWNSEVSAFVLPSPQTPPRSQNMQRANSSLLSILKGTNLDSPIMESDGMTPLLDNLANLGMMGSASNSMEGFPMVPPPTNSSGAQ